PYIPRCPGVRPRSKLTLSAEQAGPRPLGRLKRAGRRVRGGAMAEARIVDADSHVEECEEYWRYLDPRYAARRPFPIVGENLPQFAGMNAFWYIDGQTFPRPVGRGVTIYSTPLQQERARAKPWSLGSQSLTAPAERLRDLDAGGIDVQVNFPTLFLDTLTEDVAFEAALMASYNSFMAQACAQAPERLKWAAVIPLRAGLRH